MLVKRCLLIILLIALWAPGLAAEPTEVVVHVRAKGSKFIGSSMGGAKVTIRDAADGEILAQGLTAGGTGDTERIMLTPLNSTQPLTDEGTAAYRTTLDIERPTRVQVEAVGPMTQLGSANSASATQWLIPGRGVTGGDGLVLEIPGMVVQILAPAAVEGVDAQGGVTVSAQVVMGCGCPLEPGGLWDSRRMEIRGLVKGGGPEKSFELEYAGKLSRFQGTFQPSGPGMYDLYVFVHDPANGNTGLDRVTFSVR